MKSKAIPLRMIVLVISFILSVRAGSTVMDLWKRRELVLSRQQELERITKENDTLQRQLEETHTDVYVERIARDKLGLVKPGETVVIVPDVLSADSTGVTPEDSRANWRKWWETFN